MSTWTIKLIKSQKLIKFRESRRQPARSCTVGGRAMASGGAPNRPSVAMSTPVRCVLSRRFIHSPADCCCWNNFRRGENQWNPRRLHRRRPSVRRILQLCLSQGKFPRFISPLPSPQRISFIGAIFIFFSAQTICLILAPACCLLGVWARDAQ